MVLSVRAAQTETQNGLVLGCTGSLCLVLCERQLPRSFFSHPLQLTLLYALRFFQQASRSGEFELLLLLRPHHLPYRCAAAEH